MEDKLLEIKLAIDKLKSDCPDKAIYVTVSKAFNDELVTFLQGDNFKIRLNNLYDAEYRISPFMDEGMQWIVGVFDYSQVLGLWNSTQDIRYTLKDLFNNVIVKKDD